MATNFGPGETYTPYGAVLVQGTAVPPSYQALGRLFASPGNYDVTEIDLSLVHLAGTNGAIVSLLTDDAGMPGSLLASWNLTGLPNYPAPPTAAIQSTQQITGITGLALAAGQSYFLEADPGTSDSQMGWYGFLPGNALTVTTDSAGGPWFLEGLYDLGFAVFGTPETATPEPAPMLLLLIGIPAALASRKRR